MFASEVFHKNKTSVFKKLIRLKYGRTCIYVCFVLSAVERMPAHVRVILQGYIKKSKNVICKNGVMCCDYSEHLLQYFFPPHIFFPVLSFLFLHKLNKRGTEKRALTLLWKRGFHSGFKFTWFVHFIEKIGACVTLNVHFFVLQRILWGWIFLMDFSEREERMQ